MAVALALTACLRPALPKPDADAAVATNRTSNGVASVGGPTPVVVPSAFDALPVEALAAIKAIHDSLHTVDWGDWQILADGPGRKERLAWLAKDFRAPEFRRAERVDEAVLQGSVQGSRLHFGLIAVRFRRCKELAGVQARIAKSGRLNFALPVLTVLRTRAQGRTLMFVLSETPLRKEVESLLGSLDTMIGPNTACVDQPGDGRMKNSG